MRRILFQLLTAVLFSLCLSAIHAQTRTVGEAERLANEFVSRAHKAPARPGVVKKRPELVFKTKATDIVPHATENDAFYVFMPQEGDGGFVIVSSDAQLETILGYSSTGTFDENNLPDGLKYLLSTYQEEWEYLQSIPAAERAHAAKHDSQSDMLPIQTGGVSSMLDTKWNQDSPYNNLCPIDGSQRSVTGCVATATAQVMKYYKYPQQGTGSISYITDTKSIPVSFDFGNTTFDWDNMLDEYNYSSYNNTQANAVATLMAACGASAKMDYTSESSGASPFNQIFGLVNYLGYDSNMALSSRNNMTAQQWQEILLNELNANRPILFSGHSTDGGHAFVLDGYDDDDADNPSYHVNWGWGGYYDGYYKITALDPAGQGIGGSSSGYNSDQMILLGCIPENGVTDLDSYWQGDSYSLTPNAILAGESSTVIVSLTNVYNYSAKDFSGMFKLYLIDGSNEVQIGSISLPEVPMSYGFSSLTISCTVPSSVSKGKHDVIVKSHSSNNSSGQLVMFKSGNAKIAVSETGEDPDLQDYQADLQTTSFDISGYTDRTINASVSQIINFAELPFSGTISLALTKETGEIITVFGERSEIHELDQYYFLIDPRTLSGTIPDDITDGHYHICVAANQAGSYVWSCLRKYVISDNSIVDWNKDYYVDLWLENGVIEVPSYTVTTTAGPGGRVEASNSVVGRNGSVTFTIIPDEDYSLEKATLNGVDVTSAVVNNRYTADNICEDIVFAVTFGSAPYYAADIQTTEFTLVSTNGLSISSTAAGVINMADQTFSGKVKLALADADGALIQTFGDGFEIPDLGHYYSYNNPIPVNGELPEGIADGHYRLYLAANQSGYSGWSYLRQWKREGNYITDCDLECYKDLYIINGYIGALSTHTITTEVDGNKGGTVTASASTVATFGEVTFTFTAAEGYYLSEAKLNGESVMEEIVDNKYFVKNVTSDLTMTATFNSYTLYTLTYKLDGELYKTEQYIAGDTIVPLEAPTMEGYTFSGWSEIPEVMPAHDVEVIGSFTINTYTLTWMIEETVYLTETMEYGQTITAPNVEEVGGYDFAWEEYPATMPDSDLVIHGTYTVGIDAVMTNASGKNSIYDLYGHPVNVLQKGGIYILNGKVFRYDGW